MKGDKKFLFSNLSTSMYFSELVQIKWPEIEFDHWETVLPDPTGISLREAVFMMPCMQLKNEDEQNLKEKLTAYFEEIAEHFEPTSFHCFILKQLPMTSAYAQAILFRTQNPCKIVLYKDKPVLVVPEDVWELSDSVFRAFVLLGYLPPEIVQTPLVEHHFRDPKGVGICAVSASCLNSNDGVPTFNTIAHLVLSQL